MLNLMNNPKEQPKTSKSHGHHAIWSVAAIVFMVALVGASTWWLNSELQAQGSSVAKLLGMQQTVDSLSQRMIGAEKALSTFPYEMNKVTGRVDALDKKVAAAQKAIAAKPVVAPTPASPAVAELGNSVAQLNERLATLQTRHEDDAAQIASLRTELANQITDVRTSIPKDAMPDVAGLRSAVDQNQASISSLATKMDRDRHDFEIREDHASEVMPGVLLTIRETNVGRQEISGYLYVESEHRVVFLKNQGLLQPITIYGVYGKQAPHEIVITRVRKDDAVGFVLSPKTESLISAGN
jgi:uncharacterized protein YoxC